MNEQNHDSIFAKIYDVVVDWMKRDPQLRRFCSDDRQWRTWDGTPRDSIPPSLNEMPCIRLTPRGDMMAWNIQNAARPEHSFTLNIDIETWVPGTNARVSMELFEAILESLFPLQDSTRGAALHEAFAAYKVGRREMLKAGFGDEYGDGFIYGKAMFQLMTNVVTPVT